MKYTFSKEADKKIETDMKVIVSEIRQKIPKVISIYLTGGFSRGEGPVKKKNNQFIPYNDYDIQVVSEKKLNKDQIDKISIEISKKLNYRGIVNFYPFKKEAQKLENSFYIDLKCATMPDLMKLMPRIRNYELKNTSLLLFGKDTRALIPDYNLKEMPLAEGAKLLLDRMSQLVEYYSTIKDYDPEVLTYFIQQAYAAICTSLLLLSGKYEVGYKKSMRIFKENYQKDFPNLYKKIPDLDKKIEEFILWKINPKNIPNKNVKEEWFIVRDNILEASKYFLGKFLKKDLKTNEELSDSILNMRYEFYSPYLKELIKTRLGFSSEFLSKILIPPAGFVLKWNYYKRLKKCNINMPRVMFQKSPELVIFSSLIYLITSVKREKIDASILDKCQKMLMKAYPSNGKNWEEISMDYANAYIAFFMQKL